MFNKLIKILGVSAVLAPFSALAQGQVTFPTKPGLQVGGGSIGSLNTVILNVTNFFATFIVAISVIMLLYAGFKFITAGDNEDEVGKARQIITWGIVGLVVAAVAYYVPGVVLNIIGI